MNTKRSRKSKFYALISILSSFGCLVPTFKSEAAQRKIIEVDEDDEDLPVKVAENKKWKPTKGTRMNKNQEDDDSPEESQSPYKENKKSKQKEKNNIPEQQSEENESLKEFLSNLENKYKIKPLEIDEIFENVITSGSIDEIELDGELWASCRSTYRRRSNLLTFNYDLYVKDKRLSNIINFDVSLDDFMHALSILCACDLSPEKSLEKFKDMINSSVLLLCANGAYAVDEKDFYESLFKTVTKYVEKNYRKNSSGQKGTDSNNIPSTQFMSLSKNDIFDLIRYGYLEKENIVLQLEN